MEKFKTIVVEDVSLELKGTLSIIRNDIPEIEVIGTAQTEREFWALIDGGACPDLVLLDLGLGGSTTVGVDICRKLTQKENSGVKVLVFTGELLNEKLWADVLDAGAHGIVLKTGELLTRSEVMDVMSGKHYVFNEPVLEKLVERFRKAVTDEKLQRSASIEYEIDEYDERFLRHLALGYTKDMISELRTMPFSSKSLEKRQADLVSRLFPEGEQRGVNVTRLVVRAIELHIIDPSNLIADE
ncbi:MAG: response regulator transcription factor [Bacteroidaceae bacterium]|nr:response regulator transcription factor [Bacteroidaceae bacterium]